jgi:hypothetical protein
MGDKKSWLLLLVVVIVVVVAGYMVWQMPAANTAGATGGYQAVFLVNNQVYFGKLANQNGQFPVLKDIYYLQVNQPIQPVQTVKGQPAPASNPEINLVKLGGELHGPTDEMRINRDQILLVEDLRTDSNLVKAIDNYKARQAAAATPAK